MHDPVYLAATVWMTTLLVASAAAVLRLRRPAARILALDTLTLLLASLLIVHSTYTGSPHTMDTALILVLLAFVGTLAAARYYGERRLF